MSELAPGQVEANGHIYMPAADGSLMPIEHVKPQHRLQDEMVRRLFSWSQSLEAEIVRFKTAAFADVEAFQQLLAESYKTKAGGEKGNVTFFSYDGLLRIQLQVASLTKFGPELQNAKTLIDECIGEWSEGSRAELRAIVMNAFRVDKEGQVNRHALLGLKRLEIEDERWKRAMQAITDAELPMGTKPYIRFAKRSTLDGAWENVSLNISTAALAPPPAAEPAP